MVFNATFNNISVISWQSVFFMWMKPEYPKKTTDLFNIVEFFVENFICVRLFAVGNYYAIDCLHLTSSWRHVQVQV
jgi:hypothetical protein